MSGKMLPMDTKVFFRHAERSWDQGTVTDAEEGKGGLIKYEVKDRGGEVHEGLIEYDVHKMVEGIENAAPDDLLSLSELHVSVLLCVLYNRFKEDNIYTNIGNLIIAVNPFKFTIPWYKPEAGVEYILKGWRGAPLSRSGLRPHSWAVANKAYWDMIGHGNQSILISGESGAGKTEGAKIILTYLGDLCVKLLADELGASEEERGRVSSINEKLREASPILEAFGNAKTARNDNSSRFGKFMRIQFDRRGVLIGMHVTPYLLEKSRVVKAGPDERLYHSFYQLVRGGEKDPKIKEKYRLKPAKDYKNLSMGGVLNVKKVDDAEDFDIVVNAMGVVGFSEEEKDACWRVVAACLHLTCIQFGEDPKKGDAMIKEHEDCVGHAAEMLQVDAATLKKCLLSKTRKMGKDITFSPLNPRQSDDTRNSLCMFLYEKCFLWMVERINEVVAQDSEDRWIGLLDIFGFENFQTNSFEQLCINLANERLQKHYNTYVYDKDLEECQAEGIKNASDGVVINDNQPCLDLIMGGRDSVMSILDDVCKATQQGDAKDDRKFLDMMKERFGEGKKDKNAKRNAEGQVMIKREKPPDYFECDLRKPSLFSIHHYAGKVSYDISSFVGKNIDLLSEEIKAMCRASENDIIKSLIPPAPAPNEKVVRRTVSGTFKQSLKELLETIESTTPNWVRCIRPNPEKVSGKFHVPSVLDQLTCSGVVETVKTRQQGYCYRLPFVDFLLRYGVLAGRRDRPSSEKDKANAVLKNLKIEAKEAQVGRTKVFMRVKAFQHLEEQREEKLKKFVRLVQTSLRWRGSCVVVLDRRWDIMRGRLQQWAKFVAARNAMVKAHYKKVLGKLMEQQKQERAAMVSEETTARAERAKEETGERRDLKAQQQREIAPLWEAMLAHCKEIEVVARVGIADDENRAYEHVMELAVEHRAGCRGREQERKRREKAERKAQRWAMEEEEERARDDVEALQEVERDVVRQEWIPVYRTLRHLAVRIGKLIAQRDRKLKQLELEMSEEKKRARRDAKKTLREEATLWGAFEERYGQQRDQAYHLARLERERAEAAAFEGEYAAMSAVHGIAVPDPRTASASAVFSASAAPTRSASEVYATATSRSASAAVRAPYPTFERMLAKKERSQVRAAAASADDPFLLSAYARGVRGMEASGGAAGDAFDGGVGGSAVDAVPMRSVSEAYPTFEHEMRRAAERSVHSTAPPQSVYAAAAQAAAGVYAGADPAVRQASHSGGPSVVSAVSLESHVAFGSEDNDDDGVDAWMCHVTERASAVAGRSASAATRSAYGGGYAHGDTQSSIHPAYEHAHVHAPQAPPVGAPSVAPSAYESHRPPAHVHPHDHRAATAAPAPAPSGFFAPGTTNALDALGERQQQQQRFFKAGVPSMVLTDPSVSHVESYADYTSHWRSSYAAHVEQRWEDEKMAAYMRAHKDAKKRAKRLAKLEL